MIDSDLLDIIHTKIDEKRFDLLSYMERGKHQDISKYREDVGFLAGLRFVEEVIQDIYKPKEKEE